MDTKSHFQTEYELMLSQLEEGDELLITPFVDLIEKIIDRFDEQGHSGASAPYGATALTSAIKFALLQDPLSPIYNVDEEWGDISDGEWGDLFDNKIYQNTRCYSMFKDSENGKPYYLDAIIWKDIDNDVCFTGTVDNISSRQYIKEFPFEPMQNMYYIDVRKINITEDDWDYEIVDKTQLEELEDIYDVTDQVVKEEIYSECVQEYSDNVAELIMESMNV